MATEKQIAANRRNAEKSTGPNTAAGKATSSANAIKHGLLSRDAVLPGEEEAFHEFESAMFSSHGPEGPLEYFMLRKAVYAAWKIQRIGFIEAGLFTDALTKESSASGAPASANNEEPDQSVLLGRAHQRCGAPLANLSRQRVKLDREFYKAMDEFRMLRFSRTSKYDEHYVSRLKRFTPRSLKPARKRTGTTAADTLRISLCDAPATA